MTGIASSRPEPPHAAALLPAILVAIIGLGGGAAAFYAPPPTGEMAVVFAPWVDEAAALGAVMAAGGRLAGPTRLGSVVVAYAPDPGFAGRVRAAGALFMLSATALCGTIAVEGTTR